MIFYMGHAWPRCLGGLRVPEPGSSWIKKQAQGSPHCRCSQGWTQLCPNALRVLDPGIPRSRGLFPPRASPLPRGLPITTVLLVGSVVAVVHPVAVQGLGQAHGEVAAGKLPQGTRVPVPGVRHKRLCQRKRRCSALPSGST